MFQKQKSGFAGSKTFFVFTGLMLFGQILFAQAKIPSEYIIRTFIDEEGNSIDEIIVPGRPPADHREPAVELPDPSLSDAINILSNVPAFDWSYGCVPTSGAMIAGYYDNGSYPNMYTGPTNGGVVPMDNSIWGSGECPLSATHQGYDGLSVRGHVDDYWYEYDSMTDPYYGNWTEHGYADCTADYMGSNQYYNWQNPDGSTTFYWYTDGSPLYDYTGCEPDQKDGCHGFREFFESRGYSIQTNGNYTQYILGYDGNTLGFTYNQFKAEIDAGRPVMIHIAGHTMVGFGYDDSTNLVYIHDTWDYNNHTMTWGGTYDGSQHYAVSVFVLEPATSITFTDINAGLTGAYLCSSSWGDYDNDGDLDLAIAGYTSSGLISKIYRNDNGNFVDINAGLTGVSSCALSWGDYDNDGDLDLAIAGYTNSGDRISKIYRNDNGNFVDINAGLSGVYHGALSWGDYDNDGDIDLAIAGYTVSSIISKIYRNDNGNFVDINAGLTGVHDCALSWGDYDNDGDLDLAIAGISSIRISIIYRNDNGNFVDINAGLTGVENCALSWGDYDNDGDLDLVIAGYIGYPTYENISKIYCNDNGNFTDINAGLTGVQYCALSWGDYDNDGDMDIAIAGSSSSGKISKIYRNDNGNFIDINAGLTGVYQCALSWGDYYNDGDLDLAIAGRISSSDGISKIYRNDGCNNNWIDIQTRGYQSNADGVGARVKCGSSSQWREVSAGEGWVNRISHFGLGNQNEIDEVLVYWPTSGITDTLLQVQANQKIKVIEGGATFVTLTAPNGGEILPGAPGQNNTYEIQWYVESPSRNYVSLHYSTDSGASYPNLIIENTPNNGSYIWNVPDISSSYTRVRIQVKDDVGTVQYEDTSFGDFSIDNIPPTGTITLVSPANGDWTSGTPYFDWSSSSLVDVTNIGIIIDGAYLITGLSTYPTYFQTPDDLALSSGWHTWTVRGLDVAGNWVQASQTWSLQVDATPPSQFYLQSPDDGIWMASASPTFQWTPSMDNGTGLAEYQLYMNDNLVVDNIPPTNTQWSAITGSLEDDFESGLSNWNTQGSWGLTTSTSHSGNYSVTDSPAGNYSSYQDVSITLAQPVSIQGANSLTLSYWYRCDFYNDHLYVEISSNGSSWTQIADYNYDQFSWAYAVHNLDAYSGWTQVYVRFRLYTNSYGNADGFYFDDFALIGSGMELSDGDYDWYVVAEDVVGNAQCSQDTFNLHIDTTAPHGEEGSFTGISPSNNLWTADSLITFSWNPCIDDGIGLDYYELFIDGSTISGEISDTTYVLTSQQVLESGTHNWHVIAVDSLDNSASTSSRTLNIDRISPADFSLIAPADSSYFVMPTPTFEWNSTTDAGSGISHYELWIDGQLSVTNLTSTQTAPGSALSEGYHTWYVIAEDNVENRVQSTETWTAIGDWNPPTQPVLISPINNEIVSLSQPDMKWLKSTDAGSGVHYYDLHVDNVLVYTNFVPDDINADTVSVQCPIALANSSHTWYVRAFDYAGGQNSSVYGFFEVDVDITPPTSSITDPTPNQYIGGTSYLISGNASDNVGGVGVQKVEISFDGGNTWFETTCTESVPENRVKFELNSSREKNTGFESHKAVSNSDDVFNWQFLWSGYSTSSITIMTRATDFNNNVESPANSIQVNIEIIPPQITNLNISPSPASNGTVNFTIYFQTGEHCGGMNNAVTPTVTYTPAGGSVTPITQTNYQGNTWQGQTTIAQTEINGTASILVLDAADNINNIMLPDSSYTFIIDTQPPYPFDLIAPADSSWTNNDQPLLSWGTANDSTTSINNYSLEIDGSTSSPGVNYISPSQTSINPAQPLTLGTHSWRIKAVDQAGNSTWSTSTYTIGVDLSLPVSEITSPLDGGTIGGLSYTITGTSTDGTGVGVSGVDDVVIRIYHNGSWSGWMQVINTGTNFDTWSYEWTGYGSGNYTIESKATDRAGNIEIPYLQTSVYVDLNPPVILNASVAPNPASISQATCSVTFDVNDFGLNFSIHPDVWFTAANGDSIAFVETSYSDVTWTGNATITDAMFNGVATIHVIGAYDNLNNSMSPNHNAGTFTIDTQAPIVSSINVIPEITNIRNDLQVEVIFEELTSGLNSNVPPNVNIIPFNSNVTEWIPVTQTGYNTQTNIWSGIAEITGQTNEGEADIIVSLTEDLAGNVMSETTLTNQFIIDHSPPEEFALIYPSDSLWISNRQPEFIWNSSSDVFSGLSCYQLFINDNQVGANIPPEDTTHVISTSLPDGGYRTRVSALDNAVEPNIRWSNLDSLIFHVDGSAPISEITFPSSGYVVQGNSITVQGIANDGLGVYAGIGVHLVLLSSDGGAVWDTVYVAAQQFLGQINWEHTYVLNAGPHTIVCKSFDWLGNEEIGGSSISVNVPGHFIPVYSGIGYNNMSFQINSATISGIDMEAGDEISIFDGDLCVGAGVLTSEIPPIFQMVASADDPTTGDIDGFTDGNPIIYKLWDSSEITEITYVLPTYISGAGTFLQLGTAMVDLEGFGYVEQTIGLLTGWNMLSFYSEPDNMDMMAIMQGLIDAGELFKVQDEGGLALVELPPPIGWYNGIGDMATTEGYYIKVLANTQLYTIGSLAALPKDIPLIAGWNMMSYPVMTPQDGLAVVQPLIDAGDLFKVQNEAGLAIVELPPPIGWYNGIGDFLPGEGYYIKVNSDATLTINEPVDFAQKRRILPEKNTQHSRESSHFIPIWNNNPYMAMNVFVTSLEIEGLSIESGDELGIFDGDICVGSSYIEDDELISLIASTDDPTTEEIDGFTEDNEMSFRFWDSSVNTEIELTSTEISGDETFASLGTSVVEIHANMTANSNELIPAVTELGHNYPNPFNPETTINFSLKESGHVTLEIYNIKGQRVRTLVNGFREAGYHQAIWDGIDFNDKPVSSGIYLYKMNGCNQIMLKKMLLVK